MKIYSCFLQSNKLQRSFGADFGRETRDKSQIKIKDKLGTTIVGRNKIKKKFRWGNENM